MIIASAVIRTGRNRVNPASSAASEGVFPACSLSFEKLIMRMLFAVATPMHMIAPVSAGTLMVVSSDEEEPDDSSERRGQRRQMMNGSSQD